MKFKLLVAAAFTLILWTPLTSQAYFTTDQEAFSIDGKTAVFFIEFAFGHKSHDIYMPIWTLQAPEESVPNLSYEVLNDKDGVARGTHSGVVLSDATVKNGMYVIPKGTSETFTLVAFYAPSADETEHIFKAHVSYLPFSFDGTQQLQLNPSELKYYVTPEVILK